MKYKLLAMLMVFVYLFSSVTVFATELNTPDSNQENVTSESSTGNSTDTIDETSASEDTTDSSENDSTSEGTMESLSETNDLENTNDTTEEFTPNGLSTIQVPTDGGCIIPTNEAGSLELVAEGVVLMDAASGSILYSKNPDTQFYPASITKILSTLVALENGGLNDDIVCNAETLYAIEQGSSRVGLEAGEILTLEEALYFVMLQSGNDAAAVVAEHIGGSIEGFVDMMNQKAKSLGCTGSNFMNPHGLPDENHYTTARDMALIMQDAVKNPDFCKIASATNFTVSETNLNDSRGVWNHHKMILPASEYHYDGVCEGKTGYTSVALNTLVTSAERDGIKLIAVILHCQGAANTYYDTEKLFDYGFENFTILKPLKNFNLKEAAEAAGLSELNMEKLSRYNAVYNTDYTVFAPSNVLEENIHVSFSSDGPQNGIFGKLTLTYNGSEIGTLNVYYDIEAEYKTIENNITNVNITNISNLPFILVGIMAVLVILIIILTASVIIKP